MELDLTIFNKEIEAGYITPDFGVYANVPYYIKKMVQDINKEYQKFYNIDFFTFIDEECIMPEMGLPPLPDNIITIRKELEKKYNNL